MKQCGKHYIEGFEREEQRSIEFTEYPQLEKYYSSVMKSNIKPIKIILTEIYSPKHSQQNKIFGQSKSYKNIYSSNEEMCSKYNTNDYDKKFSKVDIKKKVYSNTPITMNKSMDDENCLENFKYYERKNIRDKSNQKYESITRVIGYSNLIPVENKRMTQNNSKSDLDINKFQKYKQNQNKEINKKIEKNYIKTNKKIETNYRIKKETTTQNHQNIKKEFKKPTQLDDNKRSQIAKKYEINKKQEIKTKIGNDYKQYERKKKEEIKKDNNPQIKKIETKIKKYEIQNNKSSVNKIKEKKEFKEPKIIKRKEIIRKEFTLHSGRYEYKDNISNDIINSRKNYNENSVEKNRKIVNIVQSNSKSKSKEKKSLAKKTEINRNINNNKKEEQTKKLHINITNKININSNMSNYKRKSNEEKKIQSNLKSNKKNNIKTNINNNIKSNTNYKKEYSTMIDMNKYKSGNKDSNIMIDKKEKKQLFENRIKSFKDRNNTPKTAIINFGDNYRFYERKYLQSPDDSCLTVHHLRSKKVVYEGDDIDMNEIGNINNYKSIPYIKEKRYNNQINYSLNDNEYENEDYYYEQEGGYYY